MTQKGCYNATFSSVGVELVGFAVENLDLSLCGVCVCACVRACVRACVHARAYVFSHPYSPHPLNLPKPMFLITLRSKQVPNFENNNNNNNNKKQQLATLLKLYFQEIRERLYSDTFLKTLVDEFLGGRQVCLPKGNNVFR